MARAGTVAVLAALLLLAGCSGGGDSTPVPVNGSAATVDDAAAAEAGFTHVGTEEKRLNATLRAELEGDIEVTEVLDVSATVPVSQYRRSTADGPVVASVAASPAVELVENPPTTRDPLSTLETAELVTFVQSDYGNASGLALERRRSVTVLGTESTLLRYEGRARYDGSKHDVTVSLTRTTHRGDVVTVVAVAPRGRLSPDRLDSLVGGVAH